MNNKEAEEEKRREKQKKKNLPYLKSRESRMTKTLLIIHVERTCVYLEVSPPSPLLSNVLDIHKKEEKE